jgi:hypothetical protein
MQLVVASHGEKYVLGFCGRLGEICYLFCASVGHFVVALLLCISCVLYPALMEPRVCCRVIKSPSFVLTPSQSPNSYSQSCCQYYRHHHHLSVYIKVSQVVSSLEDFSLAFCMHSSPHPSVPLMSHSCHSSSFNRCNCIVSEKNANVGLFILQRSPFAQ